MQTTQIGLDHVPLIFALVVIGFSIIIHEISHGFMAEILGDPTARRAGRLTLNPLKHIDPIGSIVVPIFTYILGGFAFGWAKPVPFNPYNLKNRRVGELLIALAGPASNLLIALVFSVIIRFGIGFLTGNASADTAAGSLIFLQLCVYIVVVNISLAVFNLVPVPPLDGSKIFFAAFPETPKWLRIRAEIERYSVVLVVILVFFLWSFLTPVIPWLLRIFTGI